MTAVLLHDICLSKSQKVDHAIESSKMFMKFIDKNDITDDEKEILRQAIMDHFKENNIKSLVGLSLVLADKLDVTYHRTEKYSIQYTMNKEIQKIKDVDINITDKEIIVYYVTENDFDINILKGLSKAVTIHIKYPNI